MDFQQVGASVIVNWNLFVICDLVLGILYDIKLNGISQN
jgi:hypothetical protein